MLKNRLKIVSSLIKDANVVADIGTDHAYLPIYLIKHHQAKIVYACDLNPNPLKIAKVNISKFGLNNQIFPVLSNGLEFVNNPEITNIDYVTICGLGAQTILEILLNDHQKIAKYIICCNTEISLIRKWTVKNNFRITNELLINEDDHFYWIAVIDKSQASDLTNQQFIEFGNLKFFQNNQLYFSYLNLKLAHLKQILTQIKPTHFRYQQIATEIKQIKEYLNAIS